MRTPIFCLCSVERQLHVRGGRPERPELEDLGVGQRLPGRDEFRDLQVDARWSGVDFINMLRS
jgi:hypothetical protein